MKIAVHFSATSGQGGVYQYSLSFLEALSKIKGHQYYIVSSTLDVPRRYFADKNFKVVSYRRDPDSLAEKLRSLYVYFLLRLLPQITGRRGYQVLYPLITPLYKLSQYDLVSLVNQIQPDLIFEPIASGLTLFTKIPTVVAIHDLEHKIRPQFKEVSAKGIFESREYLYSNIGRHAFRILVDSQIGQEDLINSYHPLAAERIIVMPFLPPSYLKPEISKEKMEKIKKQLNLPNQFVFYPAKFWPHKNHFNLVKAIAILKKRGLGVNAIFSGTKEADFSSYQQVMKLVQKLKLENQVRFLGYVDGDQLSTLYKLSKALVMPTFLGPTNIPVLEAWVMGTPVIYSNIRGLKQQLGDAGLLANPHHPSEIARQISRVYRDENLRHRLIHKGRKRVNRWREKDVVKVICSIINDFATIAV